MNDNKQQAKTEQSKLTVGQLEITVIHSARRTIAVEVRVDGSVVVRAPLRATKAQIRQFVQTQYAWILRKQESQRRWREESLPTGAVPVEELSEEAWLAIREKLQACVKKYAGLMQVEVGRITIRNQKTRWGSCSRKGNINLNYQLYYLPEELLAYVVVHELAHRKYMNHGWEFWREVETYYPAYRSCREALARYRLEDV